jgi:hypothetical protein
MSCFQNTEAKGHAGKSHSEVYVMEICITFGGKKHCFWIPIYEIPISVIPRPPGNYDRLFFDASLIASINAATNKIVDQKVSAALYSGIANAVKAMKEHAGEGVEIQAPSATRQ